MVVEQAVCLVGQTKTSGHFSAEMISKSLYLQLIDPRQAPSHTRTDCNNAVSMADGFGVRHVLGSSMMSRNGRYQCPRSQSA